MCGLRFGRAGGDDVHAVGVSIGHLKRHPHKEHLVVLPHGEKAHHLLHRRDAVLVVLFTQDLTHLRGKIDHDEAVHVVLSHELSLRCVGLDCGGGLG